MLRTRRAIRAESLRYSVPGHFRGYDRKMTCPRSTKCSLSTPFGPHPSRYIHSRNLQSERTYEKITPPRSSRFAGRARAAMSWTLTQRRQFRLCISCEPWCACNPAQI